MWLRRADGAVWLDRVGAGLEATGAFVLIDPPFEQPDDYNRAADTAAAIARADPRATVAIWTPLKDMETFDGFLRRLDQAGIKRMLVAEARLRPLTDPMKMNGCAVVVLNPPPGAEAAAIEVLIQFFMMALLWVACRCCPSVRATEPFEHRDVSGVCPHGARLQPDVSAARADTLGYKATLPRA